MPRDRPLSGLGIQFFQSTQKPIGDKGPYQDSQAPRIERGLSGDSSSTDRRVRIDAHSPVVVGYGGEDSLSVSTYDESEREEEDEDDVSLAETEHANLADTQSSPVPFPRQEPSPTIRDHACDATDNSSAQHSSLGRPRSMMELSRLNALQSLERSAAPALAPSYLRQLSYPTSDSSSRQSQTYVPLRSHASMLGLESAETGASTIQFDVLGRGFRDGCSIEPLNANTLRTPGLGDGDSTHLQRQSTLLTAGAPPGRRAKELSRLLAAKAGKGPVVLEQAKSGKGRVEVDLTVDRGLVVEGGVLRGRMEVRVKRDKEELWLSQPKVRVVGFEGAWSINPNMAHRLTGVSNRSRLSGCSAHLLPSCKDHRVLARKPASSLFCVGSGRGRFLEGRIWDTRFSIQHTVADRQGGQGKP
jgi:hypothetical protein